MSPPYICRVILWYRSADGDNKYIDVQLPRGSDSWGVDDWLNEIRATPFVRSTWHLIEVSRDSPWLRKRFVKA